MNSNSAPKTNIYASLIQRVVLPFHGHSNTAHPWLLVAYRPSMGIKKPAKPVLLTCYFIVSVWPDLFHPTRMGASLP